MGLSLQSKVGKRTVFQPYRLWWLEMSDAVDRIVSAGPLTGPACEETEGESPSERYPNIAIGTGGETYLVYLLRHGFEKSLQLHSARLQVRPGLRPAALEGIIGDSRILGERTREGPLLVSADGSRIFALESSGQVSTFSLAGKMPASPAASRSDRGE